MMLTLNDGRTELCQWDTGRTLAVDADCTQVHFSNKVFGRSIDVDVVDGAAIIPDVLLQADKDLNVWAFVGTSENGYTKISKTFKVNRRNKPADYVFTPPDQITLQTIQRQIGDLSDLATEAKENLVAAINEAAQSGGGGSGGSGEDGGYYTPAVTQTAENTMQVEFTPSKATMPAVDVTEITLPTGPAGSKGDKGADGKSAYAYAVEGGYTGTEAEFAAKLAEEMPTTLPNPNALTFTGAVTGSYDGSAAVSVEIPSGGGGSSGGSGKAKSQILIDQKITELTASLSVTLEHDFHNLTAIISYGSGGGALTTDPDGNAIGSSVALLINTTSYGYNSRKVAYTNTSIATWQTKMIGAEWSDDLSVFKRCFSLDIANSKATTYNTQFGGQTAMYGTLGTDDNAPRTGKTANIVVSGAYLNVGTRVILWGEYYE